MELISNFDFGSERREEPRPIFSFFGSGAQRGGKKKDVSEAKREEKGRERSEAGR